MRDRVGMILALLVLLVACADEGPWLPPPVLIGDAGIVPDGSFDASLCRVHHTSACNPLTQAGCDLGLQCTWILDGPLTAHIGCAPEGSRQIGDSCGFIAPSTCRDQRHDDCVRGAVCQAGRCRRICDHQGGSPQCGAGTTCTKIAELFESGDMAVAGVCQRPEASLPTEGVAD